MMSTSAPVRFDGLSRLVRGLAAAMVGLVATFAGAWLVPDAHAQTDSCPNAELRTGASANLPDCRALELVSPADKIGGAGVGLWYNGRAAHGAVGYAGYASPFERFAVQGTWGSVLTDGAYAFASDWALAQRTEHGWTNKAAATRGGYGAQNYRFLLMKTADEGMSLTSWNSNGGTLRLFPELESWKDASKPTLLRGWEQDRWELFGPTDESQIDTVGNDPSASADAFSADGSTAVGGGKARGLAGPGDPTHRDWPTGFTAGSGNVYEMDLSDGLTDAFSPPGDTRRRLVNVCSAGTEIPERLATAKISAQACPGPLPGRDAALISPRGGAFSSAQLSAERALSDDGSRLFFMSPNPLEDTFQCNASATGPATLCPAQLYVRQRNVDGSVVTRWISRPRSTAVGNGGFGGGLIAGQDASLLREAIFEGASRDGSRVFFRSSSPLTPDDPNAGCGVPCLVGSASNDSWDLFMYELPAGPDGDPATPDADPGDGVLTRVSGGPTGGSDCNSPVGGGSSVPTPAARFVASDGSWVYFICDGPLTSGPGATNGTITAPSASPIVGGVHTAANVYGYRASGSIADRWRFVAQMPRPSVVGAGGNGQVAACATTADGRGESLALRLGIGPDIMVEAANCWRGTSDGSFVTFWTDGQLVAGDGPGTADVYGYDASSDQLTRLSAALPGAGGGSYACGIERLSGTETPAACYADGGVGQINSPLPRLGLVSDPAVVGDRVAFFQSQVGLVPGDTDGSYDVYQWKNGVLSLLSDWQSGSDDVMYAGNDRQGRNVFMTTRGRLTWQDHDAVLDVYSARVGGGFAEPVAPLLCEPVGGGCHAGGGVGALGASPGSVGAGGGNVSPSVRGRLAVAGLSRAARRRAARTGVLRLRVRVSRPGRVAAVVRARLGRRMLRVGQASESASKPGVVMLRVKLNRRARGQLAAGRVLRVSVGVRASSAARTRTMRIVLRRAGR